LNEKVTVNTVMEMKENGEKISMLTAYDFHAARILDQAGIDIILLGDSLGMVFQGKEDTLSVNLEDIIYHSRAVKRGLKKALLVADMPFMSYQLNSEQALASAGRLIKEGEADAVKLEGGNTVCKQVKKIVDAGIPVMGHLGLTPQSINKFGGFKVQGRDRNNALNLIENAIKLEEAGVFSIVLESVPMELAKIITEKLKVPIIGIGAGVNCDGQVLVYHDMLGIKSNVQPKFVRQYADFENSINKAVKSYIDDVKKRKFPDIKESFTMDIDVYNGIKGELDRNGDN